MNPKLARKILLIIYLLFCLFLIVVEFVLTDSPWQVTLAIVGTLALGAVFFIIYSKFGYCPHCHKDLPFIRGARGAVYCPHCGEKIEL